MTTITITAAWRQGDKEPGLIREAVAAQRSAGDYRRCPLMPEEFRYPRCNDEAHATFLVGRAKRVIAFMEATGLQAHPSWRRMFPGGKPLTAYADHVLFWRDGDKRVLVTTEPYGPRSEAEIYSRTPEGWRALKMPPGFGMWRPCLPNGAVDTEFILLSPQKNGADLDAIAHRLFRWGPYGTFPTPT